MRLAALVAFLAMGSFAVAAVVPEALLAGVVLQDKSRPGSGGGTKNNDKNNKKAAPAKPTDDGKTKPPADAAPVIEAEWAIILVTFASDDHAQQAAAAQQQIRQSIPELAGCRVHTTAKGSMIVIGRYKGPTDPAAKADLERTKQIEVNRAKAFPQAWLSRIDKRTAESAKDAVDLLSVRQLHPNVHPLYTLQIAVWSDFESGQLTTAQIRQKAEAYARELRTKGVEAYYWHGADGKISLVTVGLYDRTAIDTESGLRSPELEAMMKKFPNHLVNGETMQEPVPGGKKRKTMETRLQKTRLVVVPKV